MPNYRVELTERSYWNIGYFVAGLLFWLYVAAIGDAKPLSEARVFWLVGTFFIFPVALLVSKVIGTDPFSKGNPLGELVGYTHMSVITLSFPLVLASFVYHPESMTLVMAIVYCLDFYVMSWAFGTSLFGIHAAVRVTVVSIVWLGFPELRNNLLPLFVAVCYLVTVVLIPVLCRIRLRKGQGTSVA